MNARFGPNLQQWRNGSPIVRNQGQLPAGCILKATGIILAQVRAIVPLGQCMNSESRQAAFKARGHGRRDVFVEQNLQQISASGHDLF